MPDPAETETAQRRKAEFSTTFDRLVESNLQLVRTVRVSILVVSACAVMSLSWSAWTTFAMRSTLLEIRAMLQVVLDAMARSHA